MGPISQEVLALKIDQDRGSQILPNHSKFQQQKKSEQKMIIGATIA